MRIVCRSTFVSGLLALSVCLLLSFTAAAQTYCSSQSTYATYEAIKSVTVNEVTNQSSGSNYSNFTGVTFPVTAGSATPFALAPYFPAASYAEYWGIWIDLNGDGDFTDAGENAFSTPTALSTTVTGTFTIPASTTPGTKRMRVILRYGTPPLSCGGYTYGETEDYTVSVSPPQLAGSFLQLNSEPGHWIGQGLNQTFTQTDGAFKSQANFNNDPKTGIRVDYTGKDGRYYTLSFDAPGTALLVPGSYPNATRFPFNGTGVGLDISTNGRGCNQVFGSYTVDDVSYNADGSFRSFKASFVHYCESLTSPALKGTVAINFAPVDTTQTQLQINSQAGHWIGQGVNQLFTKKDGAFAIKSNYNNDSTTGIQISYSGKDGRYYYLSFDAPGTALLAPGTYLNATRFPFNTTGAGLDISTNGRGCNQVFGSFVVDEVSYNADRSFKSFRASFTHYCENINSPLLTGSVAFNAAPQKTLQYCSASANYTTYEWIKSVQVGAFSNSVNQLVGYEDFTEAVTGKTIKVTSGASIPSVLTPGFSSSTYGENWSVWLDANNDGDFADVGEQLLVPVRSSNPVSAALAFPASLKQKTRMRVRMWFDSVAAGPCGTTTYGQVEDYTIEPILP